MALVLGSGEVSSFDSFLKTVVRPQTAPASGSTFVEAEVHHVAVDGLYFTVESWDAGKHVFGPAPWPAGSLAPAQGTPALVMFLGPGVDRSWVLAPAPLVAGLARVLSQSSSAGASTVVTHNFNTRDVSVAVYDAATYEDVVECDVVRTTVNDVTVTTAASLAAGALRIVVIG